MDDVVAVLVVLVLEDEGWSMWGDFLEARSTSPTLCKIADTVDASNFGEGIQTEGYRGSVRGTLVPYRPTFRTPGKLPASSNLLLATLSPFPRRSQEGRIGILLLVKAYTAATHGAYGASVRGAILVLVPVLRVL